MIRTLFAAALGMAAFASTTAFADDAPATSQDVMNILLVTGAVVDYCKIVVDPAIQDKMQAKVMNLQKQIGMSDDDLVAAGKQMTANVTTQKPDCAPDGALAKSVQEVVNDMKSE